MPFKSEAQRRWAYTKEGMKALGGIEEVKEWEKATKDGKLPEYVRKKEGEENGRRSFGTRNDRR